MDNRPKKVQSKVTNSMRLRAIFITCCFLGFVALIVANMVNIQIINYESYKAKASSIQLRDTKISPKRGTIYDANMKVLAQSATVWTVFVSPAESDEEQHDRIAEKLEEILGADKERTLKKLQNYNSYYEVIEYKIDKPEADAIKIWCDEEEILGVNLVEDFKRYYPYGSFAATILGFCGTDNQGLAGLESYYDEELTGVQGRVISAKNGWGLDMGYEYEELNAAQDGYSLVTTIDETVQHFLEKHLSQKVEEYNVQCRGVGIVMNVKTGAILAMSNKPDFDPNDPFTIYDPDVAAAIEKITSDEEYNAAVSQARQTQWRNKAVSDLYEPGSVFKIITASAALDSGAATVNSGFYCKGHVSVGGWTIGCNNRAGHGPLTFTQALIESCNPSFIDMGQRMGIETFVDYFESFGMSEKTGIDLPGEQKSITYNAETMTETSLASNSFGQTFKVTPVQMITAVATAVNGGNLVTPHLVSKLVDEDGNTVKDLTPEVKRQVISEEVSAQICKMLLENGTTGNAQHSKVPGYRVGGKSGTSQKLDTAMDDDYIASYVGVAPCDDPEIAILIFFDEPRTTSYYGGVLAGPVVGSLMGEILPYLGIEPVYTEAEKANVSVYVPNMVGRSVTDATSQLQRSGFMVKTVGNGANVTGQFPTNSMKIKKGGIVILHTDSESKNITVTVPDLSGYSPSAAENALNGLGLNISMTGVSASNRNAVVSYQNIAAGEKVQLGTTIEVTISDTGTFE
ncbi:MAG: PASTA domain-containing protein [Oscillospiraceae bacterium]|nr:PASTA domain-containing protein [Oscillospiraceae bacterium]